MAIKKKSHLHAVQICMFNLHHFLQHYMEGKVLLWILFFPPNCRNKNIACLLFTTSSSGDTGREFMLSKM